MSTFKPLLYRCSDCGQFSIAWHSLTEVEYQGQPVYDGYSYYGNLEEYLSFLDQVKAVRPPYVQLAKSSNINKLISTYDILNCIKIKLYETFGRDIELNGISELRQNIEDFKEKQKLTYYEEIPYKIKIPN